jgi:cyclohexa-1,5-dienecarbonyl-CoA hydratase
MSSPTADPSSVRIAVADGVAVVTLDRPPLNVLDIPTSQALAGALKSMRDLADVRVVVLRGAGERAFSSGVEIGDHVPARARAMLEAFHGVIRELVGLDRLTVAAVRGRALGGGFELALACDLAIAEESATFGLPEIRLGCFPPVAAILLPGLVGTRQAADLILSGEAIDARRALALGLLNRVVPDGALDRELPAYLARFTSQSGAALGLAREAMRRGRQPGASDGNESFTEALAEIEALYLDRLLATEDAREGIAAWLEKRSPRWRHR